MDKAAHHYLTNRSVKLSYIRGHESQEKRTVSDLIKHALRVSISRDAIIGTVTKLY